MLWADEPSKPACRSAAINRSRIIDHHGKHPIAASSASEPGHDDQALQLLQQSLTFAGPLDKPLTLKADDLAINQRQQRRGGLPANAPEEIRAGETTDRAVDQLIGIATQRPPRAQHRSITAAGSKAISSPMYLSTRRKYAARRLQRLGCQQAAHGRQHRGIANEQQSAP